MSKDELETKAEAWAWTGARVTAAQVQQAIMAEDYFTAAQGVIGAHMGSLPARPVPGLTMVTFCVLSLRNGTKIVGVNYGAIDPVQHDAERGKQEARADAVRQVWPLLGYELRSHLAKAATELAVALATEG